MILLRVTWMIVKWCVVLICHVYVQQSEIDISSKGKFQLFLWNQDYFSKFLEFSRFSMYLTYVIVEFFRSHGLDSDHILFLLGSQNVKNKSVPMSLVPKPDQNYCFIPASLFISENCLTFNDIWVYKSKEYSMHIKHEI